MKKLFTIIAALTLLGVSAQNKPLKSNRLHASAGNQKIMVSPASNMYSFSTFTAPYVNISGTSVSNGVKWDDLNDTIPIGFNFKLYNMMNDTINLFGGFGVSFDDYVNGSYWTAAMPLFEDLCDRAYMPSTDTEGDPGGISNLSYTTTGNAGSRICKVEVNNAGFYGENNTYDTSASSLNFQIWLYETSNDIEFHFGTMDIQNPSDNLYNPTGFMSGLTDSLDWNTALAVQANMLNGPAANPSMVGPNANLSDIITGTVQAGRVYKFTRAIPASVAKNNLVNTISLYPNPTKEKLFISNITSGIASSTVNFYDISGKNVLSQSIGESVDVSSLSKGIYTVTIVDPHGATLLASKLIIAE